MTENPFINPALSGGPTLKIRNLAGRVVGLIPTAYDPNAPGIPTKQNPNPTQELITADAFVVDGGPLDYGDSQAERIPTPPTMRIQTPCIVRSVLISNVNIVRTLKPHVGTGAVVLGRIVQGVTSTQGNSRPWNLEPLADTLPRHILEQRGLSEAHVAADRAIREQAAAIWAQMAMGSWTSPTPVPLTAAVPAVPAAAVPAAVPAAAPAAVPAAAAPVAADIPCPAGWSPAVWDTLSLAQKQAVVPQPAATDKPPF
jgi:hypothetical protein